VKHYRRAILPLPKSMTPYLDKLRKQRKRTAGDWVFVNSHGEPYSSSTVLVVVVVRHAYCC
jgi:hypothetical protein